MYHTVIFKEVTGWVGGPVCGVAQSEQKHKKSTVQH